MGKTTLGGLQITDGSVQRADLDISTIGQAVVRKLVQITGGGIALSATGADAGTGDVTITLDTTIAPTWSGTHTFNNALAVGTGGNTYSMFGASQSSHVPTTSTDIFYIGNSSTATTGLKRGMLAVMQFDGTASSSSSCIGGSFTAAAATASTGNLTTVSGNNPGGLVGVKGSARSLGTGITSAAFGVFGEVLGGTSSSVITDSASIYSDNPNPVGGTWSSHAGLWVKGGTFRGGTGGTIGTRYGLRVDSLVTGTTRYGVWIEADPSYFGGTISAGSSNIVLTNSTGYLLPAALNVSATSKLLGSSSSSAIVQEITLGSGLSLSGTTLSASGGSGTSITKSIAQTSHGFSVGDIIRLSGTSTYSKSQANSSSNAEAVGIVSAVADANNFTVTTHGYVTGLSSLTANTVYFLDPSTAGALTSTAPTTVGQISKPILYADTTTSGYFINYRGIAIASGSSGSGMSWSEVTGTTQTIAVNTGYIANNASLVTATLPTTAALGDMIRVVGKGAGGWKIAQNASQLIRFGSVVTTTGTGGYLNSSNQYDAIELVCTVANTTWTVASSLGNITYV